jgi:hypothetical protein
MFRLVALPSLLAAAVLAAPAPADACRRVYSADHDLNVEEMAVDQVPPSAPVLVEASVHEMRYGRWERHSCAGMHSRTLLVQVSGAADDRTPAAELGYRVELVGGHAPAGVFPLRPLRAPDGRLIIDLPLTEEVHAEIAVRAVDLAGNESPLSEAIHVHDQPGSGCSQSGSTVTLSGLLAFAMLLATRRRRQLMAVET